MMETVHRILITIVILWSLLIGDEVLPPPRPPGNSPPEAAKPRGTPVESAKTLERNKFVTNVSPSLDQKAFLLSFKRQALAQLNACLQKWKPSPASQVLVAVMDRKGQLTAIKPMDAEDAPACIAELVGAMDFATIAASMRHDREEVHWRVDW